MQEIHVNPAARSPFNGGRFEGWGSSFCWWANRIGYSDSLTEQAARLFYSEDGGLGLNVIRFNIGGGDDPSHRHIMRTDSAMPGYLVRNTDGNLAYDWSADAAQRKVLKAAMQACGADRTIVEAFSNSPPYFMTTSGCSSGAADPGQDNLRPDQYEAFADYLATVAGHFRDTEEVCFQSLDPMNEPASSYWGAMSEKQEGCHFEPGQSQSRILLATKEALTRQGLSDILLVGTDETSIDVQIDSFLTLSSEARAALDRIDTHTYMGSKRQELRTLAAANGKNLWMSEVDGGDVAGSSAGEMGAALALARRIIADLNGMQASAWVLWQLIDSHISAEGMNGKRDSGMPDTRSGYWGVAVADHDRGRILLTKKYWALWQFTRFIRPGMYVLRTKGDCLAAYDGGSDWTDGAHGGGAGSGRLAIVAVNYSPRPRFFKADISAFPGLGGAAYRAYRTSGSLASGENGVALEGGRVRHGRLKSRLPGNSITTFVIG